MKNSHIQELLDAKYNSPATKQEMLINIAIASNLIFFLKKNKDRVKQQALFIGWFMIGVGIIIPLYSIGGLFSSPINLQSEEFLWLLVGWESSIFAFLVGGPVCFLAYCQYASGIDYVNYLHESLFEKKLIALGEIDQIIQTRIEYKIMYTFYLPECKEQISGKYVTSDPGKLIPGGEVFVLYLNENIHVLLF